MESVPAGAVRANSNIGPYHIIREIGRGGMGIIYEALDTRLDRPVALKFLPPHVRTDLQAKARFLAEARTASALDHPNICTIYETGETADHRLFISMAYYDGKTLDEWIRHGPMPVADCLRVALGIAEGLALAHDSGIVHRDVKPSNVMLTERGEVKVLDFGLAKVVKAAASTSTGAMMGTAAYMSPEQARGEEVDHRTDIWSLGVVIYELLTGRPPFRAGHEQAVLYAIRSDQPPAVAALRPEVSASLARVVDHMLEKDPEARYQQMAEVIADLAAVRDGTRLRHAGRRQRSLALRLTAIAGAATLVAGIGWIAMGGVGWSLSGSTAPPTANAIPALQLREVWGGQGVNDWGSPSPDGRHLTFTDRSTGDLVVRNIADGSERRLAKGNPGATSSAQKSVVSPDGRQTAYIWRNEEGFDELRIIGMDGNGLRVLYHDEKVRYLDVYGWSPDGRSILASLNGSECRIALVAAEDGSVRILSTMPFAPLAMAFSPDGNYLAYDLPQSEGSHERDLFVMDIESGRESVLIDHPAHDFLLGWHPDGKYVLFASDRTGRTGVWQTEVVAGEPVGPPRSTRSDIGRIAPLGYARNGTYFYSLRTGAASDDTGENHTEIWTMDS